MAEVEDSPLHRPYLRFAFAVVVIAAALLLHRAIARAIGAELPPFITFYPAVMVVALLCGAGPGLLATVLAALAADYWLIPPRGSLAIASPAATIGLALFAAMGVFISLVAEAYRRNQRKVAALKGALALHESQQELQRSEEQFATLANAIPQLCWMANPDGWIFWYNRRWYEYTGTTPEQMEGWGWQSVHDPEALPKVMARWQGSIATGERFDMVFPLRGADGEFRPFLTRVVPVKDADGKIVRWFGTNTDIREQKRVEAELRKSKERLDLAAEVAELGEWELNLRDHSASRSLRHDQIFGYPSLLPEWSYEMFLDHVLPEHRAEVDRKFKTSLQNGSWNFETQIRRADGEVRWIWARGRCLVDETGQPSRMFGVVSDITERKQSEEALRSSEAKLYGVVGSAMDAIISVDDAQRIVVFNRAAEKIFQCPATEALGSNFDRFIPERLRGAHSEHMRRFGEQGITNRSMNSPGVLTGLRSNGEEFPIEATISQVQADGQTLYTVILRDITERKRAEETLRLRAAALDAAANSIVMTDAAGNIQWVNSAFTRMTGYTAEEAIGQNPRVLKSGKHEDHFYKRMWQTVVSGSTWRGELVNRRKDGSMYVEEMTITPVHAADGSIGNFLAVKEDISERKRAEEALQANEHRWSTTLRSIGDAVISTDPNGKIDFMNEVAQKLTGWTLAEARGRELTAVFDIVQEVTRIRPESPVAKVIRLGKVVGLANHTVLIQRDGSEIPIEDSAAPIRDSQGKMEGVVLVFHDCLEQRKVESALRVSERLATTGRLAATIAHEIHNPLDAVGNLLFLIREESKDDSTREYASMAGNELARVTQMTQQMLGFQREASRPVPVKIGEVLANVVALYERKIKSAGIHLEQQIEPDIGVVALPGELRQIFANLVGNAIEAVGSRRGTIALRAYASHDRRRGVPGLCVVVADNGPGIPAQVRSKIFEPFFTTKGESGTGLGLWITSDILRKYDGTMRLRTCTHPDRSGTCFSIFLPFEINSDSVLRS